MLIEQVSLSVFSQSFLRCLPFNSLQIDLFHSELEHALEFLDF